MTEATKSSCFDEIVHKDDIGVRLDEFWADTVIRDMPYDWFIIKQVGNHVEIHPVTVKEIDKDTLPNETTDSNSGKDFDISLPKVVMEKYGIKDGDQVPFTRTDSIIFRKADLNEDFQG